MRSKGLGHKLSCAEANPAAPSGMRPFIFDKFLLFSSPFFLIVYGDTDRDRLKQLFEVSSEYLSLTGLVTIFSLFAFRAPSRRLSAATATARVEAHAPMR